MHERTNIVEFDLLRNAVNFLIAGLSSQDMYSTYEKDNKLKRDSGLESRKNRRYHESVLKG